MAIYVIPDYQKKGIGGLLIKRAFGWLGNNKDIFVNVVSYNQKAIGFYNRFDFKKTGRTGIFDKAAQLPGGKVMPEIEMIKKTCPINETRRRCFIFSDCLSRFR